MAAAACLAVVVAMPPPADALTTSNVVVVGSSECDGIIRQGFLADRLEASGYVPSVMCLSASGVGYGVDIASMDLPPASTIVLTLGLNVRPLPVLDEPAQSGLYAPETDADGYVTPNGFRTAVRDTIEAFREAGAERIVWFPVADNGHEWHSRYVENNAILREEGRKLDFAVTDWDLLATPSMFSADKVHYTSDGYATFAMEITEAVSSLPSPAGSEADPCSYVSPFASAEAAAGIFGITEQEFRAANPHWNEHWRFGGIVCRPAAAIDHPARTGTPVDPLAEVLVGYEPWAGTFTEFFFGDPAGGGDPSLIGPGDAWSTGLTGADTLAWTSAGTLVLYSGDSGEFRLIARTGTGAYVTEREMTGTTGWSHVLPGDFDGNGSADLLFYRSSDGLMRFYTLAPGGAFTPLTPAMFGTRGWTHIVAGDFDGDGSDGVYWYRASDGLMRFYDVLPGGVFKATSPAMMGTRNWTHIVPGAFDGGEDRLLFYRVDGLSRFYEVDSTSGFTAISPVLAMAEQLTTIAASDLDGDDRADVFSLNPFGAQAESFDGVGLTEMSAFAPFPQGRVIASVPGT